MKTTIETKQVTKADGTILTYQRKRCGAKVSRWALVHSTACGY